MKLKSKHGVLIVNKTRYISSNKTLLKLKTIIKINKLGYAGTLDPLAAGCLPVMINKATRISNTILNDVKYYKTRINLYNTTDTYDRDGQLTRYKNDTPLNIKRVYNMLSIIVGKVMQVPPLYSAIKNRGRKLYEYIKLKEKINVGKKNIIVYSIKMHFFKKSHLELSIRCSKGTYIRSITSDLGYMLKCGAYISKLERKRVHKYKEEDMYLLNQIKIFVKNIINPSYFKYFIIPHTSILYKSKNNEQME